MEAKYWDAFETRLDAWFEKKVEKYRSTSPGRMGRTSLPTIIADAFFGAPKKDDK